jgi:uroporphyrin-III C-methyltransferase/precorrin-2 dehydrogenase/sirohydrochlorin ferrochelatase
MNDRRKPAEARPPRTQDLARLPVFFALAGKRVVVAGGGPAAAWKVELLSAAGAMVAVFAEHPSDEMHDVASDPPRGPIEIVPRAWDAADLAGAALAIGAFDDDGEAARFQMAARGAGVPVNVVDRPQFCDFAFGSIVNRSPLVIGISTDGAAPVFAQAVRARIEALLPRGFARWVQAARDWRARVQALGLSFQGRRKFWERFADRAVAHAARDPAESDFDDLVAGTRWAADQRTGSVTLLGAGPGDPELLTLRAVRALQSADVILFDDLVAPAVLDYARREARKMLVGKTGHGPSCRQDEINATMIALAKAGRRVARLKGGDPLIFGRAGEEIAACRAAGIAVDIVPGITAAQGAAARLGISLTERARARRLQYITGHDHKGELPGDINWTSIADPAVTTIVYMPKKTIAELAARAIAAGLAPSTPAVAVACATRDNESVIASTVADLPERLSREPLPGPLLVMIGRTLEEATAAHGENRPGSPGSTVSSSRPRA